MKIIYSFFDSWVKWVVIYWIVAILIACGVGFYTNLVSKSLKNYYPDKAVSFLKTLPLSENLFNNYGWGGYLIWKLPERKVFIDGRMPSWRQNEQFVFGDYVKIAEAQDGFDKILQKYNVGLVLISKPAEEKANSIKKNNPISAKFISFFKKHQQLAFVLGIQLPKNNLYDELIKLGWKNIYQDNVAVILEK